MASEGCLLCSKQRVTGSHWFFTEQAQV